MLWTALKRIDSGAAQAQAARIAQIDEATFAPLLSAAQAWAGLRTNQGRARLQAKGQEAMLAPRAVGSVREATAIALADQLVALGEADPAPMADWLRVTLRGATQTNAGVRFRHPETLRRWIALALQLRPADHWYKEIIYPAHDNEAERKAWSGILPDTMPDSHRLGPGCQIEIRIRLLSGALAHDLTLTPLDSSAGALRFAAHLAAITLGVRPECAEEDEPPQERRS